MTKPGASPLKACSFLLEDPRSRQAGGPDSFLPGLDIQMRTSAWRGNSMPFVGLRYGGAGGALLSNVA